MAGQCVGMTNPYVLETIAHLHQQQLRAEAAQGQRRRRQRNHPPAQPPAASPATVRLRLVPLNYPQPEAR